MHVFISDYNMNCLHLGVLIVVSCLFSSSEVVGSLSDITFEDNYQTNDLPPTEDGEKIQVILIQHTYSNIPYFKYTSLST